MHIRDSILKEAYFKSAAACPACGYKISENPYEIYQEKKAALARLLEETAGRRQEVKSFLEDDFESLFASIRHCKALEEAMDDDGAFYDLDDTPGGALTALQRLCYIAYLHHFRGGAVWKPGEKELFLKSVARYARIEADREDQGNSRFHKSIFCLPKCVIHIYFALYPDLSRAERGELDGVYAEACREIFRVALQTWTLPRRGDHTDAHPISPERFRGHVWWVGANALQYRPTLLCALIYQSVEMMDTLICVAKNALAPVTYSTRDEAFWNEGICADGFGWGHGRQTYNNGYPSDGILAALDILKAAKGTPWEAEAAQAHYDWVFHYMHGITWDGYKGHAVPMQSRHGFLRSRRRMASWEYAMQIARTLGDLQDWLSSSQRAELEEIFQSGVVGKAQEDGNVRYFQNNDDMIRKTDHMYLFINCASCRCDGVECAEGMADRRNFYTADGAYLVMKDGAEYETAYGAWQVSRFPGTTERELLNCELLPEENWRGYHSKSGFCGGVQDADSGVMGFIYEKEVDILVDGARRPEGSFTRAMGGVYAQKGYFIHGDMTVFLGAGICDKTPEYGHRIRTTVNHTGSVTDTVITEGDASRQAGSGEHITVGSGLVTVTHNGICYGFFPGFDQTVELEQTRRRTHWLDMNGDNKGVADTECDIFEVWVDHGTAPEDARYAYFIDCGKNEAPELLENTQEIQAVLWPDGLLQAVFYAGCRTLYVSGMEITVSEPMILQAEQDCGTFKMILSDPYCDKKQARITVKNGSSQTETMVWLPQGYEEGKSVQIWIGL